MSRIARTIWNLLGWTKKSKLFTSWFEALREKIANVRRMFSWRGWLRRRRRISKRKLSFHPTFDTLEARIVPTSGPIAWQQTDDPQNALQVSVAETKVAPGSGALTISQPLSFSASGSNNPALVFNSSTTMSGP